jgi:hypothetical protein
LRGEHEDGEGDCEQVDHHEGDYPDVSAPKPASIRKRLKAVIFFSIWFYPAILFVNCSLKHPHFAEAKILFVFPGSRHLLSLVIRLRAEN